MSKLVYYNFAQPIVELWLKQRIYSSLINVYWLQEVVEAPKEEVRSLEPALKDKQINKDLKVEGAAGKASYRIWS